ncbi:MAG: GGDEF domain-containing protein [Lachnospiraceae bacterium]
MQEQKFVRTFRTAKIIQLCILLGMELTFFLILACNATLSKQLYSNKVLFTLCAIAWILMIFSFLSLLYDFFKLRSFAVESHALKQAAYFDSLTGIPNRHSLDTLFQTYTTPESLTGIGCAMFTIRNLKEINEANGHSAGDRTIKDFCTILEEIGDPFGFIGRNGGNEFVAVINDCSHETLERLFAILENRISLYNKEHTGTPILLDHAYTLYEEEPVQAFTQLLTATYNRLYHIS